MMTLDPTPIARHLLSLGYTPACQPEPRPGGVEIALPCQNVVNLPAALWEAVRAEMEGMTDG